MGEYVRADNRDIISCKSIVSNLWEWVQNKPTREAVISDKECLTYSELWDRSGALANALIGRGVGCDEVVGVFAESSIELQIAIWGVLRAGAAYLPMSPDYPPARLRHFVRDSRMSVILVSGDLISDARSISADVEVMEIRTAPSLNPDVNYLEADPSQLAYVIYTSGSTGNPKGVMIEHHSIAHQMDWLTQTFKIGPESRVLQKTPFSFDAAQWELLAVAYGATVIMAGPNDYRDVSSLVSISMRHKINVLQCVPTLWEALIEEPKFSKLPLKALFSGGEALTSRLSRSLLLAHPNALLTNLYGPTETTINASAHVVRAEELTAEQGEFVVPIGKPAVGTGFIIVSPDLRPVRFGDIGELLITGEQLARGYIGAPQISAERFVYVSTSFGITRAYRTGDLARQRLDGVTFFAGRIDNQVKINGYRVELDEIRLSIESHRWIRRAAVSVVE